MADDALECTLESRIDSIDEDRMLAAAAQTDKEAAERLYDKYYSQVLDYIYHSILDGAVAEDLTSNVFLAAFRQLAQYRRRQVPFRAWLFRIAINEVRMHWRRKKRFKIFGLQQDGNDQAAESSAGDNIADAEEYLLLYKALSELRIKYRTVIILRYFEGKTIAEISEITDKKVGTVKSQLHRGLARLQDILVQCGVLGE